MADSEIANTGDAERLQARLAGAARRRGVPDHEAEDVAADAIAKAATEAEGPSRPPLEQRASVALRDVVPEFFRRDERAPQILSEDALPEPTARIDLTEGLRMAELYAEIRRVLGDDGLLYAILLSWKYTEAEIAELPGWDKARAARVRKRVERQRGRLRALRRNPEEEPE